MSRWRIIAKTTKAKATAMEAATPIVKDTDMSLGTGTVTGVSKEGSA